MRVRQPMDALAGQLFRLVALFALLVAGACKDNSTTPSTMGLIQVTVATTGADLDPDGYAVSVDAGTGQAIGLDGSVTFNDVLEGPHQVSLSGLAANCSVAGSNPVSVTVTPDQTSNAAFAVVCISLTGDLSVTTITTGSSLDADGYSFVVDGGTPVAIAVNQTVTSEVTAGSRSVQLTGVAANCTVAGDNPRSVTVPGGGSVGTTFVVSCSSTLGSLVVSTVTTGTDIDPDGYSVSVDGGAGSAIGVNGTLILNGLPQGDRQVLLSGLAANCSVTGANPATGTVTPGISVSVNFAITCVPIVGSVQVLTATTGVDLDPDGYTVAIQGVSPVTIGVTDTIVVANVPYQNRTVELQGLASNCTVQAGVNPRTVNVPANGSVSTTFVVNCVALQGTVSVTAATTGANLDPDGYAVSIDGGPDQALSTNGTILINNVPTGSRDVLLKGIAANCTVDGGVNPKTVVVPSSGSVSVTFNLSCAALLGDVQVTTVTTGSQADPDGYSVEVEGKAPQSIGTNATVTVVDVNVGTKTVELKGLASNCTVTNNPRSVNVTDGGVASTTFNVNCPAKLSNKIVFDTERDGNAEVYVMTTSGTGQTNLSNNSAYDAEPFVSPDGTKIAFVSDRAGNKDIWVMDADGANPTRLTTNSAPDTEPAWSPDGTKIVFSRGTGSETGVYIMDANGSNQTVVTDVSGRDGLAQFSPDGSRIVFTSARDGDQEIWLVDLDGNNLQQLTFNSVSDFAPAWSPDGFSIVFTSERDGNREIYVMGANGSGQTNLTNNAADDLAPQWSPDGNKIAFASERDGNSEVYVMNANGTGPTNLTNNPNKDFEVSWSP